jgi:hypothetical protein
MSFEYDIPKCHFIRTNGTQCKSPALKGAQLCYHHQRDAQRVRNFLQARGIKDTEFMHAYKHLQESFNPEVIESIDIPALDDAASIQVALTNLLRAICYDHITDRKAGLALFTLQQATLNLARLHMPNTEDEPDTITVEDPHPIGPLCEGREYRAHLARRGIKMLSHEEKIANSSRADEEQEKQHLRRMLQDAV